MHPAVSRELVDGAVDQIAGNAALLVDRGWTLLSREFPVLRMGIIHRTTCALRVFEFYFADWNDQPPALRLVDAETHAPIPGERWPTNGSYWHHGGWSGTVGTPGAPFMCMPGIREYHNHSSHLADLWANYKDLDAFSLGNIVSQVSDVYQKSHVQV